MPDISFAFDGVTPDLWASNEASYLDKLLKQRNWTQIPLINSNPSHHLTDGSLVRFRGMIQDMHNPEFYFEKFEVYNSITNDVSMKSGKYRDTANVLNNEKINYTENLLSSQRHTMVVISIPGLNEWAQKLEDKENYLEHLNVHPNTSKRVLQNDGAKLKRSYDETEDDGMEVEQESNKEPKIDESPSNTGNVVSREHLLNFPLPDVPSQSCIVKLYEEENKLKLNEIVEVVGFLSVDPSLSGEFKPEQNALEVNLESEAETITLNPPPSLVPRVHAVYVKRLPHCNPLVGDAEDFNQELVLQQASAAREHLLRALTELLLGDALAAEYLICHLVSCIYLRQETMCLGQFCLNLSNLPTQKYPDYAKQLYDIIRQFVTKSHYLPLTIENMNTLTLLPKKDYECNRLTSGILQLSPQTHLVLDETRLQQGRLDAAGVSNVAALGTVITTQKVQYDFKYYKMDFEADFNVLILSEGKSLLPCDFHVPLKPEDSSLEIFNAIVEAATYYLKEDIMNVIRTYITSMKMVKYNVTENLKFVEDDFLALRSGSTEEEPVTADDLHRLLVLARLVSVTRGQDTLSQDCWQTAMDMERQRKERVRNRVAKA